MDIGKIIRNIVSNAHVTQMEPWTIQLAIKKVVNVIVRKALVEIIAMSVYQIITEI